MDFTYTLFCVLYVQMLLSEKNGGKYEACYSGRHCGVSPIPDTRWTEGPRKTQRDSSKVYWEDNDSVCTSAGPLYLAESAFQSQI